LNIETCVYNAARLAAILPTYSFVFIAMALSPEDQARVDAYNERGYNDVERKPFRPLRLLFFLFLIVSSLGGISYLIAKIYGVV
jgi:hypothetical protein